MGNFFKSNNITWKNEISNIKIVLESTVQDFNDIQVKCLETEEKLDESKKEVILLRNERKCDVEEMEENFRLMSIREQESKEMIRQRDMMIKENVEAAKSLKVNITSLKNKISEMKIVMQSTTSEQMQQIKLKNDGKDTQIKGFNEKICMITEEKMKIKSENEKSLEDLELSKKVAEHNFSSSQQEVAKEITQNIQEVMSLQQQQHLSSTEPSMELLKSMEVKRSVREKELNNIKGKCVQYEEKLDECKNEILRKERKYNEMDMADKMKLGTTRDEDICKSIRQRDIEIEEQLDAVNSLKNKSTCLKNKISDMRFVMKSTTAGPQKEMAQNDIKNNTIEELMGKMCGITEEKMKMKSEDDRSTEDLELSKKVAEDELLSQEEVAKEAILKLEQEMTHQQQ